MQENHRNVQDDSEFVD